jgi:hypothetical protein
MVYRDRSREIVGSKQQVNHLPMKIRHAALPLLIVILYFYLHLFANALTDDAFITLRYVKTLLDAGAWGFLPGHVTNAVTSPLNVFLLVVIGAFLGPTVNAVIWLSAGILALTTVLLIRISLFLFETRIFGYLAAGTLIFNPLIISTLGLESLLFIGLYILSAYLYLTKRWSLLAVALGLITLTRFDGILFFFITLLLIPTFGLRVRFAGIYLLCMAPWYMFSWIYLGSLLPDTLFIKIAQHSWGTWDFFNGLNLYYSVYRFETIFSFLLLPFVLLLFNKQVRRQPVIQFLLLTSMAHFAGYSVLHVPPYYWYYIPEITAIILIGSFGLGVMFRAERLKTWKGKGIQSIAAVLLIVQAAGMFHILTRDGSLIKEMPIHTNWATHEQFKQIGEWLKEHDNGGTILVDGEIGTLGYYCDCSLSSFFSDRRWLGQYARQQIAGSGIKALLYKVNFLFLDKEAQFPQPVYLLTEMPNGESTSTTSIMEWQTSTQWIPNGLIELTHYAE